MFEFMPVDLTGINQPACGAEFLFQPVPPIRAGLSPAAAASPNNTQAARSARSLCPGRSPGQKTCRRPCASVWVCGQKCFSSGSVCVGLRLTPSLAFKIKNQDVTPEGPVDGDPAGFVL
jgi:hypothetical protein